VEKVSDAVRVASEAFEGPYELEMDLWVDYCRMHSIVSSLSPRHLIGGAYDQPVWWGP